jgi:hypothetical protein
MKAYRGNGGNGQNIRHLHYRPSQEKVRREVKVGNVRDQIAHVHSGSSCSKHSAAGTYIHVMRSAAGHGR